jgi:prevent-host-death family protein
MNVVGAYEAKTHLSELLARASAGEEFAIAKNGRVLARLMPANPSAATALGAIDALFDARRGIELQGDLREFIEEGRRA